MENGARSRSVRALYIHTSRSGSRKGNDRRRTALTSVKTVVAPPMPMASIATAAAENTGWRAMSLTAWRTSPARSSTQFSLRADRHAAFAGSMPPNAIRARRSTCPGDRLVRTRSSALACK